jgi:hypothetical protein
VNLDLFVITITIYWRENVIFKSDKTNKTMEMGAMESHCDRADHQYKQFPAKDASSLKGTLVGVLFIAGVIVAIWLSVFFLFLSRM